jgi:hypothetical protein
MPARLSSALRQWREQDVLLHFGRAVDYRCHRSGSTRRKWGAQSGQGTCPFWFDIAPYVREGSNRVMLRVEDRQDAHQPRGKQSVSGVPNGIDYYCTTGIWQTVWLEPAPPMRIHELNITPHLEDKTLELRVFLHAPSLGWHLQAKCWTAAKSWHVSKKTRPAPARV